MAALAFAKGSVGFAVLTAAVLAAGPAAGAVKVDPKADVHPTAVLMGDVTVGAYTKIGPKAVVQDIQDTCWVGMNATVRGSPLEEGSAVGNDAVADFNTHLEKGAVLAHGAVTTYDAVIPANALAEGNPAQVTKRAPTDADRQRIFGLIPPRWIHYEHDNIAKAIDKTPPKVQKSYPGIDGRQHWGSNVKVDPMAKVHPTVILVGNVTIGRDNSYHANFNAPSTNLSSANLGRITSAGDPRILQLALKLRF